MNIFICGGCKNGKSALAQELAVRLSQDKPRFYVATMIATDEEDRMRIRKHIADRAGLGFETLEIGRGIADCLGENADKATYLIDSVTALLANEMFYDNSVDSGAFERCRQELLNVLKTAKNTVIVSDYIFSDAARFDTLTEQYRQALGALHCSLANACDTVVEMCTENVMMHKGELPV